MMSWELPVPCCNCKATSFEEGGFGMAICLGCGTGKPGSIASADAAWRQDRVLPKQYYTRTKRFKKYLFRAMRLQSATTVPEETWRYLFSHGPYRDAKHVQRTLKQAQLKRKCYDSLPFLTSILCPHLQAPTMTEVEKMNALRMFRRIDMAVREGPFVSYLYCLEYILERMGRSDVVENINRIKCHKRRVAYKLRLDEIFGCEQPTIMMQFRTPA